MIVLKKFNRGRTFYKRRFDGNREACKIEIRNFFRNNNIRPAGFFSLLVKFPDSSSVLDHDTAQPKLSLV